MPEATTRPAPSRAAQVLKLIGAWAVVAVPALWGVGQVAVKAMALFR